MMVAALAPHKDYPTFIRCAAEVAKVRNDVHFIAVGQGELQGALVKQVSHEGLHDRFSFTGFRDDVPALLGEAHLFMLTSKTEGLGTSVIDALYNGLPVVATRAGGIPELVEDGVQGALCRVGDATCLSEKVLAILGDQSMHERMAQAAQKRALQFSSSEMAQRVLEHYQAVVAEEK